MKQLVLIPTLALLATPTFAQAVKVDGAIPAYQRASGVSGTLNSVGSDTMNNLMTLWGEAFAKMYPNVNLYGRNSASGTYGFFKEHVLTNGDYKDTVKEQPGSASVVQGVTEDRFGVGYSGIGYRTSGVKVVSLAAKEGAFSDGSYPDVVSGKYPLARFLYLYVNRAPNKPLDPVVREFLKLVFSKEGQDVVLKDGYLPLTAEIANHERAKLE